MEKALTMQAMPATALQRAQRTPVATPSTTDPPTRAARSASDPRSVADRVSISSEARQLEASNPPRGNNDRLQGPRSGAMPRSGEQMLSELKENFFTREGDEGFNARLDFNSDGVINAGDLGVLREKMAGYASPANPPAETEPVAEPEEVATLDSIRNAFYTREGDEGFNAASDLNGDGMVNAQDLGLFRQSQADVAEPVQPVPAPLTGGDDAAAVNAVAAPIETNDPAPTAVDPGISALATDAVAAGLATSANAGSAPSVDVASVRESLLDQLRDAFFSREGDDRFNARLDSNSDGLINVADFLSVRDSA